MALCLPRPCSLSVPSALRSHHPQPAHTCVTSFPGEAGLPRSPRGPGLHPPARLCGAHLC